MTLTIPEHGPWERIVTDARPILSPARGDMVKITTARVEGIAVALRHGRPSRFLCIGRAGGKFAVRQVNSALSFPIEISRPPGLSSCFDGFPIRNHSVTY